MSDVDQINAVAQDPVPSMPEPLDTDVKLLRGLLKKTDGEEDQIFDVASVKELTGADEEYLASIVNKKGLTYTEYMTALLDRAVLNIGPYVVAKAPGILNKLILADRDMLFLGVLRATYGNEREINVTCRECGTKNDVVIELDKDFPVTQPDFDVFETFKVKTRKGTIQLRLPTGEDTIAVQKNGAASEAEINTAMLARCAVWEDGQAPANALEWARDINIGDRRKLVNTLLDIKIGPSLEGVDTQCSECGSEMPILLDWVSLLLS